jgi:peptidyl-tRNA hydrolase, PTH1 family
MHVTKVVVGLGNPGLRYQNTPHNLGFSVIDLLAGEVGVSLDTEECRALIATRSLSDFTLLLVKPQTFMNLSGGSIAALLEKFGLSAHDLIVVCDDLALPFGEIRIRGQGSSGGHKGLDSIIEWLTTNEFVRVRLGVGPAEQILDTAEYVLTPIPAELKQLATEMSWSGKEAVKLICSQGLTAAMNKFN